MDFLCNGNTEEVIAIVANRVYLKAIQGIGIYLQKILRRWGLIRRKNSRT